MLNTILDIPGWCAALFLVVSISLAVAFPTDHRNIENGWRIPTEGYADQPYIIKTDDNAWLCAVTTGWGEEGETGQHIISSRSTDFGQTWETPVDVEPSDGPEASYSVLFKTPSGRIFVFYNHNTDNVRRVKADNPPYKDGWCYRVDSQGYFVFKFSDDHGCSWSDRRFPLPMRLMDIDRENAYGGEIRFFWNVGKPFSLQGSVYVPLCKVGGFGDGFFTRNEGVLLKSDNLLTEPDLEKFRCETLPDGEAGLRTPPGGGPIAGEHSYAVLSDGTFYVVYRSVDGHPVCAYSRDGGHTWTKPRYQVFADGRKMRHPRAANFIWKCRNEKYLYWFHNHGGTWYDDRNPAWLCGGVEVDSPEGKIIHWSQPEIVLYDDDPLIRMSYPDFIEENGRYFISETQKEKARIYELDPALLHALWGQSNRRKLPVRDWFWI
ncbi:exo-alpha-sialidase [bacterium]|nr:exo-alpha-sialidase [bacterium]